MVKITPKPVHKKGAAPEKKILIPEKKILVPEKKSVVPEKKSSAPEKKSVVPEKKSEPAPVGPKPVHRRKAPAEKINEAPATPPPQEEQEAVKQQEGELSAAASAMKTAPALQGAGSWDKAISLVKAVRPTPGLLWCIVRAVLGKQARIGKPDWIVFDLMEPLLFQAARDAVFAENYSESERASKISLAEALNRLGYDVAAALCMIHGICRKVSARLAERVWRPIIDDALLRAHIGYYAGASRREFGRGRGLLAGFAGRCGLAVQIASGDIGKAQKALEGLAAGMPMQEIGVSVYGCDPLQVSAMTLAAAGCSTDAAYGIASFNLTERSIPVDSTQFQWLAAFSIAEFMRMNDVGRIDDRYWHALNLDAARQQEIKKVVQRVQRKGHHWSWITEPQTAGAFKEDEQ